MVSMIPESVESWIEWWSIWCRIFYTCWRHRIVASRTDWLSLTLVLSSWTRRPVIHHGRRCKQKRCDFQNKLPTRFLKSSCLIYQPTLRSFIRQVQFHFLSLHFYSYTHSSWPRPFIDLCLTIGLNSCLLLQQRKRNARLGKCDTIGFRISWKYHPGTCV